MNLISVTHHSYEKREYAFMVLREYTIISQLNGPKKFTSWVKMLANRLNPDIFNSHPPNMLIFGLIIYMYLVQLNGLDFGIFGLGAYAIPKSSFSKILYCTTQEIGHKGKIAQMDKTNLSKKDNYYLVCEGNQNMKTQFQIMQKSNQICINHNL